MYYYGSMPQGCGCCQANYGYNCCQSRGGQGYALILVLFILLVIIGASAWY